MILPKDIEVTIAQDQPPKWLWEELHKAFDIEDNRTIYTYGSTIHNPFKAYVADHMVIHETVHMRQQAAMQEEYEGNAGPERWWRKYIDDPDFRLDQEAEAYGKQYWFYCQHQGDRNLQAKFLWEIANHLSGGTYKLDVDHSTAQALIRSEARKI